MNNNPTAVETLFEKIEDYTKTTIELTKLKTIDKSADVLSSLVSRLIVSLAAGMFMLLLNFGLSYWIGEMLGNSYYGFFLVALFYLLVSIILYTNRNSWIKLPISNSIIAKILKKNEDEN